MLADSAMRERPLHEPALREPALREPALRECALRGCAEPLQSVEGRPAPTYCSAAHRARARAERRAQRAAAGAGIEPPPPSEPGAAAPPSGPTGRPPAHVAGTRRHSQLTAARRLSRTRALAALTVAGILAAGTGFVVVASGSRTPPAAAQLGESAFSMDGAQGWAAEARVRLSSMASQLEDIARAEQEWSRHPAAGRAAQPAAVLALAQRKELLQRQQAILHSQLAVWESLQRIGADLAAVEAQLASAERTLQDLPGNPVGSPEEGLTGAQLLAQRDLLRRQRDAKRTELAGLQRGVAVAMENPVPDTAPRTAAITGAVRDLTDAPVSPPAAPQTKRLPAVAARDNDGGRPKADVGNGAPPRPRGVPGDDPEPAPKDVLPTRADSGPARAPTPEPRLPARPSLPFGGATMIAPMYPVGAGGTAEEVARAYRTQLASAYLEQAYASR